VGLPVAQERDQALAAVGAEVERIREEASQLAGGRLDRDHAGGRDNHIAASVADDRDLPTH
jgi:hypothetical protein